MSSFSYIEVKYIFKTYLYHIPVKDVLERKKVKSSFNRNFF